MPNTDPQYEEAVDIVAKQAIAVAVAHNITWEDFPELGEHDWETVIARIKELAPYPDAAAFNEAYEFLEELADE